MPEGFAFAALPGVGGGLALAAGWSAAGLALLALSGFVLFFFRNPSRRAPGDERDVVAPADGRVIEAGPWEDERGSKRWRVGIFLSIFDVHVNRAPVAGRVVRVERRGGGYRAAFRRAAPEANARVELELETPAGERVQVVQIAGWIARRIVCWPAPGAWLGRGMRYGLIRFGSRTDVILPASARLEVRRGQRVRGGSTIVARLEPEGVG